MIFNLEVIEQTLILPYNSRVIGKFIFILDYKIHTFCRYVQNLHIPRNMVVAMTLNCAQQLLCASRY